MRDNLPPGSTPHPKDNSQIYLASIEASLKMENQRDSGGSLIPLVVLPGSPLVGSSGRWQELWVSRPECHRKLKRTLLTVAA
jgi:hypothetical protein